MAVTRKALSNERIEKRLRSEPRSSPMISFGSLLLVVTYILAALAVYLIVSHALQWGTRHLDNLRYGFPRSDQISGVVGHGDSVKTPTHFVALNLNGQVSILEVPGGDTSQVRVLAGPYLFGDDGAYEVPKLALRDLNGDGLRELIVTIRGELIVYVNDGATYRLSTAAERAALTEEHDRGE